MTACNILSSVSDSFKNILRELCLLDKLESHSHLIGCIFQLSENDIAKLNPNTIDYDDEIPILQYRPIIEAIVAVRELPSRLKTNSVITSILNNQQYPISYNEADNTLTITGKNGQSNVEVVVSLEDTHLHSQRFPSRIQPRPIYYITSTIPEVAEFKGSERPRAQVKRSTRIPRVGGGISSSIYTVDAVRSVVLSGLENFLLNDENNNPRTTISVTAFNNICYDLCMFILEKLREEHRFEVLYDDIVKLFSHNPIITFFTLVQPYKTYVDQNNPFLVNVGIVGDLIQHAENKVFQDYKMATYSTEPMKMLDNVGINDSTLLQKVNEITMPQHIGNARDKINYLYSIDVLERVYGSLTNIYAYYGNDEIVRRIVAYVMWFRYIMIRSINTNNILNIINTAFIYRGNDYLNEVIITTEDEDKRRIIGQVAKVGGRSLIRDFFIDSSNLGAFGYNR